MKKLILIISVALLLSAMAIAEPDSLMIGPYKVSFDLGLPRSSYIITTEGPTTKESLSGETSTIYDINIQNQTGISRTASITLDFVKGKKTKGAPEELELAMKYMLAGYNVYNIDSAARTIDGNQGAVASGDLEKYGRKMNIFTAYYYRELNTTGRLDCIITSTYPWDEGTLQLLKTVHAEKAT